MANPNDRLETKLIHAGEPDPRIEGAVSLQIFQSAMFETAGGANYHDIKYIRMNNTPNHVALHKKLAALENAEDALVLASGMAAITTTLLTVLSAGDHLLAQNTLYGGTHDFLTTDLKDFGIAYDFLQGDDPNDWKKQLRPNTKAIYVESMTNPLLDVTNLSAVPAFAKEYDLVSIIDNTFASPVNYRPPEWGYDLSLHSCTKYLNGHSDIGSYMLGTVTGKTRTIR
jgi:cystathionine beta-lyase/cystathionine gamma-synthase